MSRSYGALAPARHPAGRARLAIGLGSLVVTAGIVVGMTASQRLAEGRSKTSAAGEAADALLGSRGEAGGSAVPAADVSVGAVPVTRSGAS